MDHHTLVAFREELMKLASLRSRMVGGATVGGSVGLTAGSLLQNHLDQKRRRSGKANERSQSEMRVTQLGAPTLGALLGAAAGAAVHHHKR
jgi:hypothetical protein